MDLAEVWSLEFGHAENLCHFCHHFEISPLLENSPGAQTPLAGAGNTRPQHPCPQDTTELGQVLEMS